MHGEAGLGDLDVLTGREPARRAAHPHFHHIVEDGVAPIIVRWKPFQGDVLLGDVNGLWLAGGIRLLCKTLQTLMCKRKHIRKKTLGGSMFSI